MKVLMLGWELPPHNSGGLGVACENLARALVEEGAELDFVLPYKAEHPGLDFMHILYATDLSPLSRFGWSAYDCYDIQQACPSIDCSPVHNSGFESMRQLQHIYGEYIRNYFLSRPRSEWPDVVHVHDWLTLEAGVLAKQEFGVPVIAHVHATEYDRSGMLGGHPVVHEIERSGLLAVDKVLAVSDTTRQLIHDKYGVPLDKIEVAYNALPEEFINADYEYDDDIFPYLRDLKAEGYTIVVTVGRFTIQKGLTHLLNAARLALHKNPKLMFIFAGDGEERNELIRLAAEYGVGERVIFTGFVRGKRLRDIYSVADIFVMSSVSEPFGLTALEAAHHGALLILTKQSGVAELLHSALTYDFWDDQKLAEQIIALSQDPALQRTLHAGLAQEYNRISWHDVAKKCLQAYARVWRNKQVAGQQSSRQQSPQQITQPASQQKAPRQ